MDESDSDSDSEDDQSVTEEKQLLIAADAAATADAAAIEERDQKLSSLLERKNELPLRTRNTFNALVLELLTKTKDRKLTSLLERKNELPLRSRNKCNNLVFELLTKTKDDIHEMICDNNIEDDDYGGLDSSRDTEAQVETAIRFFPEVISQPCVRDGEEEYPIQRLCISSENKCNVKAVSFIAVVAPLAIEFHSFEDHERGGLLLTDREDDNTFRNLMYYSLYRDPDDLLLTLLIRLRRMGLFKKDDIRDYDLVSLLCCDNDLPERVLQFLVEWDPTSLLQTDEDGWLTLAYAARTNIRCFQIVFGYGIRYYPFKKGINLLFQKDNDGDTAFQDACQRDGRDTVMEIVEEILICSHSEGTPLAIVEALMEASVDENVHLDYSYFLLRREPDVLVRLLSGSHNNNNKDDDDDSGGDKGGDNHNEGNDVDDDEDHDEDHDGDASDGDDDEGDDGDIGNRKRKRGV